MSIPFSNTTTDSGIIQVIEQTCGFQPQGISGNSVLLKQFTGKVNRALDNITSMILQVSGKWQYDDSNHTDYPFITTNLVSGQRDYPFTTDEQGNLILDVYRVMVKNTSGIYQTIDPVDQQSGDEVESFYDGLSASGLPFRYDKTGNAIFLDTIPNYNSTNGLKVFINRESSHFLTTDTTKMPGFKGTLHEYLPLKASEAYARDKRLANYGDIVRDIASFEARIKEVYGNQSRDETPVLTPVTINSI